LAGQAAGVKDAKDKAVALAERAAQARARAATALAAAQQARQESRRVGRRAGCCGSRPTPGNAAQRVAARIARARYDRRGLAAPDDPEVLAAKARAQTTAGAVAAADASFRATMQTIKRKKMRAALARTFKPPQVGGDPAGFKFESARVLKKGAAEHAALLQLAARQPALAALAPACLGIASINGVVCLIISSVKSGRG
jgi:hypothetical protein